MSDILIISCSLNPDSNSRKMARAVTDMLKQKAKVELVDLQDIELPFCDGGAAYGHANVVSMTKKIQDADCIIVATPIYNYNITGALKNLVELTGPAWSEKVVGFLCAAGGRSSYMSVLGLANSLMLDFRSIILPRFVYAQGSDFSGDKIQGEIFGRLETFAEAVLSMTKRLCGTASVPAK
jgi:FMN reductase